MRHAAKLRNTTAGAAGTSPRSRTPTGWSTDGSGATHGWWGLVRYVFELSAVATFFVPALALPHSKHLPAVEAEIAAKPFRHRRFESTEMDGDFKLRHYPAEVLTESSRFPHGFVCTEVSYSMQPDKRRESST